MTDIKKPNDVEMERDPSIVAFKFDTEKWYLNEERRVRCWQCGLLNDDDRKMIRDKVEGNRLSIVDGHIVHSTPAHYTPCFSCRCPGYYHAEKTSMVPLTQITQVQTAPSEYTTCCFVDHTVSVTIDTPAMPGAEMSIAGLSDPHGVVEAIARLRTKATLVERTYTTTTGAAQMRPYVMDTEKRA